MDPGRGASTAWRGARWGELVQSSTVWRRFPARRKMAAYLGRFRQDDMIRDGVWGDGETPARGTGEGGRGLKGGGAGKGEP